MNYLLLTLLAILALSWQVKSMSPDENDDSVIAEREAQFYCYKHKSCTPGGSKVCGYDPYEPRLAEFRDTCSLYKANCDKRGRFKLVEQVVCDTRMQYDKEHENETFEWIHVATTRKTPPISRSTLRPIKVKLVL